MQLPPCKPDPQNQPNYACAIESFRLRTTLPEFQEPFLVPTIGGFAQLEWHSGRRSLEFEGTESGWSIVGSEATTRGGRAYHEAEAARFEVEKLIACYRWFQGAELLWPIMYMSAYK